MQAAAIHYAHECKWAGWEIIALKGLSVKIKHLAKYGVLCYTAFKSIRTFGTCGRDVFRLSIILKLVFYGLAVICKYGAACRKTMHGAAEKGLK